MLKYSLLTTYTCKIIYFGSGNDACLEWTEQNSMLVTDSRCQLTNILKICLKMSQQKETAGPDVWQISVLYDVEKISTLLLTVTKDCCTAELFEKLRQHPKVPQIDDFQLFSISATIRSALVESREERLSDYGITERSTLALVANLNGGVWPTLEEVAAQPRHLKPVDGITLTTISEEHPDVLGVEDDGPGVIMRCGHATAPTALALFCRTELEKGKDEIRCPKCDVKWKFALLKPAACLTLNEITEFERKAHINYFRKHPLEMKPCPKCGIFSRPRRAEDKRVVCRNCTQSLGKKFQFCWTCLGEWKTSGNVTCGNPNCGSKKRLLEILESCETKKLNGIDIPSKRACPNCSALIQHLRGRKRMTCRYCRYEFCFICLKKIPCGTDLYQPCNVAPRQTFDTKCIGSTENGKDKREPSNPENLHSNDRLELFLRTEEENETEILADDLDEPEALVHIPAEILVSTQQCILSSFNSEMDFHSEWSGYSSYEELDEDYYQTFFGSNLASQVNEMDVTTDEGSLEVTSLMSKLRPLPGYIEITTTDPDMLGLDDSPVCAKMPCGHVIGPESMAEYIKDELQKGNYRFYCPGVDGSGKPCNSEWQREHVRHVACCTAEESRELERKISDNFLKRSNGMQTCPGCRTWCFRDPGTENRVLCPICTKSQHGREFAFCWLCLQEWRSPRSAGACGNPGCHGKDNRLHILATCPTKQINRCTKCPSIRGCPRCGLLIEHKTACAHTNCTNCQGYGFCFICLREKTEGGEWQCSYAGFCTLAPRQTSLPGLG